MIFLMCVATIQHLNYSTQESKQKPKKHNLQFIFLTHLWPWKKSQGHQTNNENVDHEQGYNHAMFERSHFNNVQEKGDIKVLFKRGGNVSYLPWTCAKIKNCGIFMSYLTKSTIVQSYNLIRKKHKILSWTCLTLRWPWNTLKFTE